VKFDDIKGLSLEALEALYNTRTALIPLAGQFDGIFLQRLDEPGKRRPLYLGSRAFEFIPFGIDFDTCHWYFLHPVFQIGKFRTEIAPSRWRDCDTVKLHYDVSKLPSKIKNVLYDEVKPLSASLYLGLGGFNQETGFGDQFFFALHKR